MANTLKPEDRSVPMSLSIKFSLMSEIEVLASEFGADRSRFMSAVMRYVIENKDNKEFKEDLQNRLK